MRKKNYNTLSKTEQQRRGGYISFFKTDGEISTINYISKIDIPINLNKITYTHYKNITKMVYTYKTTYPGKHEWGMMIYYNAQHVEKSDTSKVG